MTVKLLIEQHLDLLSLKGGCTVSSESTLVKMPHHWKSHVVAHFLLLFYTIKSLLFWTYAIFLVSFREAGVVDESKWF